jgi:elongation factor P--(R)-beta-lysine ligase
MDGIDVRWRGSRRKRRHQFNVGPPAKPGDDKLPHMSRWQDLKNDPKLRERLALRERIIAALRCFFVERGFTEVETPTVVASPGMEPNLAPFETRVTTNDGRAFAAGLITSPEYAMKKLLAAGYERIFEIARVYRNGEPVGGMHNPEFTMVEWYRANADYEAIMRDTEEMVVEVAKAVLGTTTVPFRGRTVDLAAPWERMSVAEAFREHADMDLAAGIDDPAAFVAKAAAKGAANGDETFEDTFFKVFLRDVEPKLGQDRPVILYDYPASMAALSVTKASDPRFAERFEAYVAGIELCNAFTELTDPVEQHRRLLEEQEQRRKEGKTVFPVDEDFLAALAAMPPSAGIALGVDRLVVLLTDASDLRDVLYFPAEDIFSL